MPTSFTCPHCQFVSCVQACPSDKRVVCDFCKRPLVLPESAGVVRFYCPSCGQRVFGSAGSLASCPSCKQKLMVPQRKKNQPVLGSLENPARRKQRPEQPTAFRFGLATGVAVASAGCSGFGFLVLFAPFVYGFSLAFGGLGLFLAVVALAVSVTNNTEPFTAVAALFGGVASTTISFKFLQDKQLLINEIMNKF